MGEFYVIRHVILPTNFGPIRRLDINMSYLKKIPKDNFSIFTTFVTHLIKYTGQIDILKQSRMSNQYRMIIEY